MSQEIHGAGRQPGQPGGGGGGAGWLGGGRGAGRVVGEKSGGVEWTEAREVWQQAENSSR